MPLLTTSADGERKLTSLGNVIAGSCSGGVSRFIVAPLDVLKIRFQTQYHPHPSVVTDSATAERPKYKSLIGAARKIVKEEGFRTLWAGNLTAEALWITFGAVQFSTYHFLQNHLEKSSPSTDFICGATAGVAATVASYPFDLIRTRFASQGSPKLYHSTLDVVRDIFHRGAGVRGLFAGLAPTLFSIVPHAGMQFVLYEYLLTVLHVGKGGRHTKEGEGKNKGEDEGTGTEGSIFTAGLVGAIAGAGSKVFVYPFDTVKKRLQIVGMRRSPTYGHIVPFAGMKEAFVRMVNVEGVRALFRGVLPAVLKSAPGSGISFATFEYVKSALLATDL
jgi:solute carrier family 25 thiamine pyrophosphate transporter 19